MRRIARHLVGVAAIVLAGCASLPPPVVRPGVPSAELDDRLTSDDDNGNPRIFVVVALDDAKVRNGLTNMRVVGSGPNAVPFPFLVVRTVEAKPMRVAVHGQFLTRAPIDELVRIVRDRNQKVDGELVFEPKAGGVYRLNGLLGKDGSAIWIEDFETGLPVSDRVVGH